MNHWQIEYENGVARRAWWFPPLDRARRRKEHGARLLCCVCGELKRGTEPTCFGERICDGCYRAFKRAPRPPKEPMPPIVYYPEIKVLPPTTRQETNDARHKMHMP